MSLLVLYTEDTRRHTHNPFIPIKEVDLRSRKGSGSRVGSPPKREDAAAGSRETASAYVIIVPVISKGNVRIFSSPGNDRIVKNDKLHRGAEPAASFKYDSGTVRRPLTSFAWREPNSKTIDSRYSCEYSDRDTKGSCCLSG